MSNKTNTTITDAVFLDSSGKKVQVKDVVSEKECWYVEKEKRWALSHRAIQKLANEAGISKNYEVFESETIQPNYKNELEHIVRVKIKCLAKKKKKGCVHDHFENFLIVTGEANRLNTPKMGRGYLRKMAEKRAYDIAVLQHIGIYDTTFSEEESETMTKGEKTDGQSVELSNVDLEAVKDQANRIVSCKSLGQLKKEVEKIKKEQKTLGFTEVQMNFLDHLSKQKVDQFYEEEAPF